MKQVALKAPLNSSISPRNHLNQPPQLMTSKKSWDIPALSSQGPLEEIRSSARKLFGISNREKIKQMVTKSTKKFCFPRNKRIWWRVITLPIALKLMKHLKVRSRLSELVSKVTLPDILVRISQPQSQCYSFFLFLIFLLEIYTAIPILPLLKQNVDIF